MVKKYLIRLKISSVYNSLINNYHFIVIGIISVLLLFNNIDNLINFIVLLVLICIYFVLLFIKNKTIFIISFIICILIITALIFKDYQYQKRYLGPFSEVVQVVAKNGDEITFRYQNHKYLLKTDTNYQVGDYLYIKGKICSHHKNHFPNMFNYQKYLQHKNIYGYIEESEVKYIRSGFTISKINYLCQEYYETHFDELSSQYLQALVIGNNKALNNESKLSIQNLGISHLFVVSGLHVNIIILIIEKLLKLLKIKSNIVFIVIVAIISIYVVITNFSISVIRVFLMLVLSRINRNCNLRLSSLDIISICIIINLLINPYLGYQLAFILSYIIVVGLILARKLNFSKNIFINMILTSTLSIAITLPICININNEINIMSILYNVIYIPIVTYIILPISIIVSFIPFLGKIYYYLIYTFDYFTNFCKTNINTAISLPTLPIYMSIAYYVILVLLLSSFEKKQIKVKRIVYTIMYIVFFIIWYNLNYFNYQDKIYFMDISIGEATLLRGRFGQNNILIDTGEAPYQSNTTEVVNYLRSLGIRKLDYVIITHSDSDHYGGFECLNSYLKVKKVITNEYEEINEHNTIKVKTGQMITCGNWKIKILSPISNLGNRNDNSLVLTIENEDFRVLMSGDIEKLGETSFSKNNRQKLKVDILKVPHHGSRTSSSKIFLEQIDYHYAVIMNGYNNFFDFPHEETLMSYQRDYTLVTSIEGTLVWSKRNKRFKKINY